MTPDEMRQRAIDVFTKRFHCSQAVLLAGQEKMNTVNEDVLRAVGLFAGGLSGTRRVCGALTGGVALISSLFSRGNLGQKEDPRMWSMGHRFITEFEKLTADYGGTNCSDIARVNWEDRQQVKEFYGNPESRRKICVQLVGDAACALGKLLEELPR